jgi:hypothetical protein
MTLVGTVGSVDGQPQSVFVSSAHVTVGPSPQRGFSMNAEQVLLLRALLSEAVDALRHTGFDDLADARPDELAV